MLAEKLLSWEIIFKASTQKNGIKLALPKTIAVSHESFYSSALKTLISVSTVILLGLIVAYHALEVQEYHN
uniref:Uncharacterized protein n=1 Tax=Rhodnius prolixus TaxID=13249 RepID=T1HMK1_RHOPR